jgi:hypothetical protein
MCSLLVAAERISTAVFFRSIEIAPSRDVMCMPLLDTYRTLLF